MNSDEFRTEGELDLGELLKDEMLFSSAESNRESSICNKLRQFNTFTRYPFWGHMQTVVT